MTTMRLASFTLPTLFVAACSMPGERNGTGVCPAGEVCSPTTPQGLTFEGATFANVLFDSGIHPTATGGRQRISIYDPAAQELLRHDFVASTDGSSHDVLDQSVGVVNVHAHATGYDRLRIDDPQTGELFDRVGLQAADAAMVAVHGGGGLGEVGLDGPSIAQWAGTTAGLVIALYDGGGNRLVDEGLVIETSTGMRNTFWDLILIDPQPVGAIALTATLGSGQVFDMTLPVVDHADDVVAQPTPDTTFKNGSFACFTPRTGGMNVFDAPFQFTVSGPATLAAPSRFYANCAQLQTVGPGTGLVTVTARVGAVQGTLTLPAASSARTVERAPRVTGPTLGEVAVMATTRR